MKVSMYREAFREAGITLLERSEENVSLQRVLRHRLGSQNVLRAPRIPALTQDEARSPDGIERERRDESMVFREPGAEPRVLRGLVCADSPDRLASFVLDSCEPTDDTPFAKLLARARERKGALGRKRFAKELGDVNERARQAFQGVYAPHGRSHEPETDPRYPFITSADLDRTFPLIDVGEGPARMARAGNGAFIWAPTALPVSGRAIRRLAFVIPFLGRESSGALVFDGESFRRVRTLGEIPDDLANELELLGTIASRSELDLLPSPHLRARALVRIPPGSELRPLRPSRKRPAVRELENPAFVVDSRVPVRLERDLPVFEEPEVALAVLTRTSSGIYLPDEVPEREPQLDILPEEVTWLVLCEVGGPL